MNDPIPEPQPFPPAAPRQERPRLLTVRMSDDEMDILQRAAEGVRLSVSEFVRDAIRSRLPRPAGGTRAAAE